MKNQQEIEAQRDKLQANLNRWTDHTPEVQSFALIRGAETIGLRTAIEALEWVLENKDFSILEPPAKRLKP